MSNAIAATFGHMVLLVSALLASGCAPNIRIITIEPDHHIRCDVYFDDDNKPLKLQACKGRSTSTHRIEEPRVDVECEDAGAVWACVARYTLVGPDGEKKPGAWKIAAEQPD